MPDWSAEVERIRAAYPDRSPYNARSGEDIRTLLAAYDEAIALAGHTMASVPVAELRAALGYDDVWRCREEVRRLCDTAEAKGEEHE